MQLKHTGPKAMISHTGIAFDMEKKDKYRYLQCVVHLLKAIDHEYDEGRSYTFAPRDQLYSDNELQQGIRRFAPEAETEAERRYRAKVQTLDAEIAEAERHRLLGPEERTVFSNNLRLMRDYRLQRTVNKSFYYSALHALAVMIAHKKIRYILAPFGRHCFHVFHSIEGVARELRLPLSTRLEVFEEKGELMVRLECSGR